MKTENRISIGMMARLAILAAIIILMAFTPIGYLKIGPLAVSFLSIPVAVGAIVLGPASGAFLGGVFGATSLIQCFGLDAFGTMLLSINPIYTVILCFVPRILMGWFCGLLFKAMAKTDKTKILSFAVASLSAAILNTILFMGALILFFGNSDYIRSIQDSLGAGNLFLLVVQLVGIQGIVEAIICMITAGAISKALYAIVNKSKK